MIFYTNRSLLAKAESATEKLEKSSKLVETKNHNFMDDIFKTII